MVILPSSCALYSKSPAFAIEQELLSRLASEPWLSRFDDAEALQELYMQHFRHGGVKGLQQISCFKVSMFEQIKQEGLFSEILRWREGRPFLDVNGDYTWPSTLPIEGSDALPVLFLNGHDYTQLGCLAYFSVNVILLIQSIASSKAVEEYEATIRSGKHFPAPIISHDRTKDVYYVNDGHHRLVAAQRAGQTHLLGRILYNDSLPGSHYTIAEVKIVPHEEYVEEARKSREESRMTTVHRHPPPRPPANGSRRITSETDRLDPGFPREHRDPFDLLCDRIAGEAECIGFFFHIFLECKQEIFITSAHPPDMKSTF